METGERFFNNCMAEKLLFSTVYKSRFTENGMRRASTELSSEYDDSRNPNHRN